jgi:Zn-dependent protease with chaperone function
MNSAAQPPKMNRLEKQNRALFEQMKTEGSLKPRFTLRLLMVLVLSLLIQSLTILLAILGINWLILTVSTSTDPNARVSYLMLAIIGLGLTWAMAPRSGKAPVSLKRKDFPNIYALTDRIAAELKIPVVDGICVSIAFNAEILQVGWRRKTYVNIGLPLWVLLTDQEKISLLAHELAHKANGDFRRKTVIYVAYNTLWNWYEASARPGVLSIVLFLFAGLVWLFFYGFSLLLFHENRRSEYLADVLAARVAGTQSTVSGLVKTNIGFALPALYQRLTETKRTDNLLGKFQQFAAGILPEQIEQLEHEQQARDRMYALTHPPLHYRIAMLKTRSFQKPRITLSELESAALQREFTNLEKEVNTILLQLNPNAFIYR